MAESADVSWNGIHHLALTVTDVEASAAWYQRLLGMDRLPVTFPHYDGEETGYGVLLVDPRSGTAIGLHTNTANAGEPFDEARTGLDHVSLNVATRADLEVWVTRLDQLGVEHTGIRDQTEPFPFATVVFRDPDNIQLELIALG
jgi:catechol 2,3-dioxygenase-like lactoylglutathione lyase family enzyme